MSKLLLCLTIGLVMAELHRMPQRHVVVLLSRRTVSFGPNSDY